MQSASSEADDASAMTGCSITKLPVAIISIPNVTIEGWDSSDLEKTNAFVLFAIGATQGQSRVPEM